MKLSRRATLAGAAASGFGARGAAAAAVPANKGKPTARPAAGPTLALGALFPFTAEAALLGDESYRGLVLATETLNGAGGLFKRQVVLKKADAPDPSHAAEAAKALIGKEKVAAIFGTGATPMALAASEAAGVAGVPYFELTATGAAVTGRNIPTVFRSCPQSSAFADVSLAAVTDVLAPLWKQSAAALRLGILANGNILGTAISAAQVAGLKKRGLQAAQTLSYPAGTVDFAPLIRALMVAKIEVLLHTGVANDVVLLFRAMQQAGWQPRMVIGCGPAYAMADTRQAVGPALDGTMAADFPPYAVDPHIAPGVSAVETAYRTRYGAAPRSGLSLAAYVGAGIFFTAIARAGTTEGKKLRGAVLATNAPCGASANGWGAAFDQNGQNIRARAVLVQWQAGQAATVYPRKAAVAEPQDALAPLPAAPATPGTKKP